MKIELKSKRKTTAVDNKSKRGRIEVEYEDDSENQLAKTDINAEYNF